MNAQHLRESVDHLAPGIYTADSTDPGYGSLMAALESGHARFLGEDYIDSGLRSIANAMHRAWTGGAKFVPKAEAAGHLASVMSQFTGATDAFKEATNVAGIAKILEENAEKRAAEESGETRPPDSSSVDGPQQGEEVEETKEEKADAEGGGETARPVYTAVPEMAEVAAAVVPEGRPGAIDNAIKLMAVEFDFYIHNEIEGCTCGHSSESHKHRNYSGKGPEYKLGACGEPECDCGRFSGFRVPKRFMPSDETGRATMSPTLRKISRFWGEVCRAILIAADKPRRSFGVGWMFDSEYRDGEYKTTEGEYVRANGENWLLLNPYRGGNIKDGELFKLRNDADLKWIFSIAVHECSHLTYGEAGRDEGYARELTEMIAKSADVSKFLRKIRDAVVKRPPGWKPAPKPAPKVKPPKLRDDVEKIVADAGKEFKKASFSSAYLPKLDQGKSWWDLLTDFEDGGKRVHRIRHGGAELYRSPPFEGYDKAAAAAQFSVTLDKLRYLIAETYGARALVAPVDSELTTSLEEWVETVENKLHDSGGHGGEFYGTSGAGKTVEVEFARATDDRQNPKNSYDVTLRVDNRFVGTKETTSVPRKDDWQKVAARAIIKAVTPMLAERWRQ